MNRYNDNYEMDLLCHIHKWVFFQISWGCQVIAALLSCLV